jgi:YVTN family beta-propeller protein
MRTCFRRSLLVFILAASLPSGKSAMAAESGPRPSQTVTGMPAVVDPNNLYSETRSDKMSPAVAKHLSRVYVPNRTSNDVWVIDPESLKVIDKFKVGINPQHVVPSWD